MNVKMRYPLLLLLMAFMAIVTIPLVHGQVSGITEKDDIISSANFPSVYENEIEATHSISVLPRHSLSIRFIEFDLEYDSNCNWDSLKIIDTSGKELFFGCGQMHGNSVPAAENFTSLIETSLGVTITFKTDRSVTKKGFQLKVQQLVTTLLFLGPGGGSSGKSEVFFTENSDFTPATCTVPQYPITDMVYSVGFIYEDYLHICGGSSYSSSPNTLSGCFYLVNATWSPATSMLSPRSLAAAVRMNNGSVLVSGGLTGSWGLSWQSSELLTGSTWTPAMQLPSARYGHCMLQLSSGEIFMHGGHDGRFSFSDTHISQDHARWEKVMSSKNARYNHACTEVTINSNRQVWVGGNNWGNNDPSSEIFQLVDGTWTWTDGPDLPNVDYFVGELVGYNGELFYSGGFRNKNIYQLKDDWRTQQDAWTKIGEMTQTTYAYPAMMITEDICQGEKPTIYDPELTPSEYNACEDGSCAYVGGELATTLADLVSNSNETIYVECCTSGVIIFKTCGNGISCSTICGQKTGCMNIKAFMETDSSKICSSSMDTEDWCQQTEVIDGLVGKTCTSGGERKKRNANFGNTPIFRLSYCPYRVKTVGSLARYPECCFHPAVRQRNRAIKKECCKKHYLCG